MTPATPAPKLTRKGSSANNFSRTRGLSHLKQVFGVGSKMERTTSARLLFSLFPMRGAPARPEVTHQEGVLGPDTQPYLVSVCCPLHAWSPTTVRLVQPWICSPSRSFMDLKALLSSLNDFASLSFAESWDNVGLLVEPSPPHTVSTLFLTNDLTEEVMEEALQKKADLILSYHPPIFRPMKRITWKTWKERLVIRALENRVGIYSPHTAYDAAPQGVNHWLAKGLGTCTSRPIHPSKAPNYPTEGTHRVEFNVNHTQDLDNVMTALKGIGDVSVTSFSARYDDKEHTRISLNCTQKALMQVVSFLSQNSQLYQKTEIVSLEKPLLLNTGMGRLCTLDESVSLEAIIQRIKSHLKLTHLRLALGVGKTLESQIKVVALCAGSGSSVLQGVEADLYLTGEMSHHDLLDAASQGINVILCEHSNSERGFLSDLQEMLGAHLENKINIILSETDRDPLHVV